MQQAALPVRYGGLGIRSAIKLAPTAFLASAAGTSNSTLNGDSARVQMNRDAACSDTVKRELMLQAAQDQRDRAQLLASQANYSADWLYYISLRKTQINVFVVW